jgi:hypothetical protein
MADSKYTLFEPRQATPTPEPVETPGFFENPVAYVGNALGVTQQEQPAPPPEIKSNYTLFEPRQTETYSPQGSATTSSSLFEPRETAPSTQQGFTNGLIESIKPYILNFLKKYPNPISYANQNLGLPQPPKTFGELGSQIRKEFLPNPMGPVTGAYNAIFGEKKAPTNVKELAVNVGETLFPMFSKGGAIGTAIQSYGDLFNVKDTASYGTKAPVKFVGKVVNATTASLGLIPSWLAFTTGLEASKASESPISSVPAKVASLAFEGIAKKASEVGGAFVTLGPIPDSAKEILRGPIESLAALGAQLGVGHAIGIVGSKKGLETAHTDYVDTLQKEVKSYDDAGVPITPDMAKIIVSDVAKKVDIKIPTKMEVTIPQGTVEISTNQGLILQTSLPGRENNIFKIDTSLPQPVAGEPIKSVFTFDTKKQQGTYTVPTQEVATSLSEKLSQKPQYLPTQSNPLLLGAPKEAGIQGKGFTATDKVIKSNVEITRAVNAYTEALQKYNTNPTPLTLKRVLKAKDVRDVALSKVKEEPQITAPVTAPEAIKQPKAEAPVSEFSKPVDRAPGVTKAASDINKTLVSKGFDELPLEEQAKYTPIKKEAVLKSTADLLEQSPDKAKQIALGNESGISGAEEQVIFNALKNKAAKEGDIELLRQLANSPVAKARSEAAQTLGASGFNNLEIDPVADMQSLIKSREKASETRSKGSAKKDKTQTVKDGEKAIKDSKPKIKDWSDFISSIKC